MAGLLIGRGKKTSNFAEFSETDLLKKQPILWVFRGIFGANFAKKTFDKKRLILWEFSEQILLEIDRISQHFVCFCEFHWILQIYLNIAALLPVKYQKPGPGLPENLSF